MGLTYSAEKKIYDWKPELPDFRDNIYKYQKINSKIPEKIDLRENFKEYSQNFGNSMVTSISAILDSYNVRYNYSAKNGEDSIRNCIKNFKILDQNKNEEEIEEYCEKMNQRYTYSKICNFRNQMKQSLYDGYPIIFGFTIFESFEKIGNNGILPNPDKDEKILGGLCAIIVGYDNEKAHWIVRHPFGKDVGDNGYIYIPYEILSKINNLTSDYWRIITEE